MANFAISGYRILLANSWYITCVPNGLVQAPNAACTELESC